MPITPSQARELRGDKKTLASVCKKIDAYLVSTHHWPAYWGLNNVVAIDTKMVNDILAAYGKAGWDVELINDHRDGDCLKFSERDEHNPWID